MENTDRERFTRWQQITINQFTYNVNTLLIITSATIGFTILQLLDKQQFDCTEKLLLCMGILLLVICVAVLLCANYNRLIDFRNTTKIANNNTSSDNKKSLRAENEVLGEKTWDLFHTSLILFAIGQLLLIVGFAFRIL